MVAPSFVLLWRWRTGVIIFKFSERQKSYRGGLVSLFAIIGLSELSPLHWCTWDHFTMFNKFRMSKFQSDTKNRLTDWPSFLPFRSPVKKGIWGSSRQVGARSGLVPRLCKNCRFWWRRGQASVRCFHGNTWTGGGGIAGFGRWAVWVLEADCAWWRLGVWCCICNGLMTLTICQTFNNCESQVVYHQASSTLLKLSWV